MRSKTHTKEKCSKVLLVLHPTAVVRPNFVISQVKWWFLVTVFITSITLVPGFLLARGVEDWNEIVDSVVITFGVRTLALLSKLIIDKLFDFINGGKKDYIVRGGNFFTKDNPLIQFLWERKILHKALEQGKKIGDNTHRMASHPKVWLLLIVLSYIVRLAPDMLGASLVAQNEPYRIVERIESITAPDLGFGDASGLQLRGNCVWARGGPDGKAVVAPSERRKADKRFGFIIWQYCVDVFREQEVDSEFRTLRGVDRNGKEVKAVFHIEVITEEVFTESWEPFSNETRAQAVFDSVISSAIECPNDTCMKNYRTEDMRIIYALLTKVGMHERSLRGDNDSLEKLRTSTGRVIARLPSTTRTSFVVLIVAVNVIFLAQSVSNSEEEVEHIALQRAISELKRPHGGSELTAIALPRGDASRSWGSKDGVQCYVVGDASCSAAQLLERVGDAVAVADEGGGAAGETRHGRRWVRATVRRDVLQWRGAGDDGGGLAA